MTVTRFAPSPTGYLHIGGARTALFNWLYARHTGGKFILRIEDTDTRRNTPTAMQQVIDDLKWVGLDWDEGPQVGGDNGPYLQSERLDIYNGYIKQLIDSGRAYYCFDTTQELTAMRDKAAAEKRSFIYRVPDNLPDKKDVEKAAAAGRPVTVRFAMPQTGDIIIEDIVRGTVKFSAAELGDFIIQKSDGFPTYHFACVVDDELMGVTHVCRGQEHLMNTPYHQSLQDAFGFRRPAYAHMSVTISESGGKLSKRERPKALKIALKATGDMNLAEIAAAAQIDISQLEQFLAGKITPDMLAIDAMAEKAGVHLPEINLVDFFKSGYIPEALMNFLALLGWSSGDNKEVMTVDELINKFDFSRLAKTNSLFDRQKLLSFNTEHIKVVDKDRLVGYLRDYLTEIASVVGNADDSKLAHLIEINSGARTLEQIETKCRFAFIDDESLEYDNKAVKKVLLKGDGLSMLAKVKDGLCSLKEVSEESIEQMLRGLAEQHSVGLGKVAQPLRVAICGTTVSPPIFDSVQMLGIDRTVIRIDLALKKFSN